MVNKIKELITSAVQEQGLEIYDVEFIQENNEWFLRIYLDKDGGIDLTSIVDATTIISEILDEKDPIEQEYVLEVSSPGAERPLNTKDKLQGAVEQYVRIEFNNPTSGLDFVEGYLKSFENDQLVIEYLVKTAKKKIEIDYDNVKKARIAIKF
ncbi:ribosome maturation factor RimP [Mycoplasma sp. P36-A1]|uniref:ribosome maturation factor RimP n=1 Tax=Mycoplasma sp. P36-A1 TaxID=3252900 RepID=UPI003C2AE92A